jgi:Leucine rich repeat
MLSHLEKVPPRAIKRWWGIATAAALVLLIAAIQDRAYTAFVSALLVLPLLVAWFFAFWLSKAGLRIARERIAEAAATRASRLDLSNLFLMSVPTEICQLTALQQLHLRNNLLTTLPPEIGQLTALQQLHLGNNALLTTLPSEIGQLTALQELDLSCRDVELGGRLTSLPPEIGRLTALRKLDLGGNCLRRLPTEIGQLTALQELRLAGNRLRSPPRKVARQGVDAIRAYLRELR